MEDGNSSYAQWLKDLSADLDHPFARDSERMVDFLREIVNILPREYRWRLTDLDGFRAKVDEVRTPSEMNRVYWEDAAKNLEAWGILSLWRGIELLDDGISVLNAGRFVSSAVLSRALLELATQSSLEGRRALFRDELSLDGAPRHTAGILPMVSLVQERGINTVFLPSVDAAEAALVEGMPVPLIPPDWGFARRSSNPHKQAPICL